jgi:hypothetical protein
MIDLTMQNYTAQCPWQFANDPTSPINSSGPVLTGKTMALKIYADLYKSATDPIDLISNLYYASRIANAAIADQNQINAARSKHSLNSKTVLDRTGSQVGFNADIDHLEEFRRDLDAITRQIPLLFRRTKLTRPPDELLQSQFELLRLRLELVRLTENWQKGYLYLEDKNKELIYMKLYRMLPQIVESAEKAPQLLPVSLTQRLIEIVLCGDRLRGLEFGRKLVEMYERLDRNGSAGADLKFTNVMGICHLLLYPTVFDQSSGMLPGNSDSAPPSNENSYDSLALLGRSAELNVISSSDDAYVRINRPAALESILVNSKIAIPLIKLEQYVIINYL